MGRLTARTAVAKALFGIDRPYEYLVPPELEADIRVGMRVLVPFGAGNRGSDALVLSLQEQREDADLSRLKTIRSLLDREPVLDEKAVQLALWMRERCFCTLYDCVRAMLPAGLFFSLRDRLVLVRAMDREWTYAAAGESGNAKFLLDLLYSCEGEADMEQIRGAFGTRDPNPAIRRLTEAGAVRLETSAQRGIGDKTQQLAVLALPAEEAMAMVTPRRKSAPMRYAVTELLCTVGSAGVKDLCYFTGASPSTVKSLERSGILTLEQVEVFRRVPLEEVEPAGPLVLNGEQQAAFEGLDALSREGKAAAALLFGVTGSGKTLVYIRLIQEVLARGRTALMLVPEIALTPQMLQSFASWFGKGIAVLHSSLRAGERYDEWKRARNGDARVVIGTRSAVFAPLKDLGLIIMDEEQEGSYKSENTPRYHARDVAKYRCVQNRALLVLGSATPSVETMYHARQGTYRLFELKERYNRQPLPEVTVVDMKQELRAGSGGALGSFLRLELKNTVERGEQAILFLNRRGASRVVMCGECGNVPECPRCSVNLTYHSANGRLMCHHCGFSMPLPPVCPACGGPWTFDRAGTQKVEEELEQFLPDAGVLRMDTDTVSASNTHSRILERFRKKEAMVLLGTQMVAKGLDFENVTLVGAVDPDLGLYIDDFRAAERTFSLLTQVVGRAGRGSRLGRAVIQTCTPESEAIRCAAEQDYETFYQGEITYRSLRGYPPFQDLLRISFSGMDEAAVLRVSMRMKTSLEQTLGRGWTVLGPAPAPVAKVNSCWRYRLTLTGRCDHAARTAVMGLLRAAWSDRDSRGVSVYADLDPYSSQ